MINALEIAEHNQLLFQQIQTIAAIGHIQKNWITNTIECSKEVFDILEIEANNSTVTNELLLACVHPDDRLKLLSEFEKHIANKLEFNFVHRIQTPDKKTKYIQQKAITNFNEKGEPIKSVGIFADITQTKLAEISLLEKIAEAEAAKEKAKRVKTTMELTLEQAVDAVITINCNGKMIFVNQAACLLFGYSKEELMGENVNLLIKNEHHFKHNSYIKNHLDTQENKIIGGGIEVQLENKAGKQFWGQLTLSKVNYLGEIQFTAFIKDISIQKQIADELSVREKRFQELALHSRSVTWEVDANGLYTYVSEAAETVFGYLPEELVNKFHCYDLHPADGREAFKKSALAVFEKKASFYNLPNAIACKNGSVIWVSTNGIPMLNEQGELIGYRGSDTDITQ
ncbi:MAG: PAS domain S-box protein, partial [Chitinophagaceae bacterium]